MKTEVRLHITRRAPFAEGYAFGEAGPYERQVGRVEFALDPGDPANAGIVDLDKAPVLPGAICGSSNSVAGSGPEGNRLLLNRVTCWGGIG